MKPCNESEIVGLKSMQPSKDYYKGYDVAEKNYMRILDKIRAEIEHLHDWAFSREEILRIIDKSESEEKE